jgi:phage-related minor tail protein
MARNLTVGMRLQADFAEGLKRLDELEAQLARLRKAGGAQTGADGMSALAANAQAAATATRGLTQSATAAAGAQGKLADQAGKTSATRVKGLADANRQAERAAAAAAKAQERLNRQAGATPRPGTGAGAGASTRGRNTYGRTAGEQAQAMRQLPAQVTDIVTGLASGQSPLMVLIQQGGQLRDSFGGVVPAARALLGAISPTVVAVGGLAAAAGAVAVGMYQASEATNDFNRAVELTGNRAGVTSGSITELAAAAAGASQQTVGATNEIATRLVATGEYGSAVVGKLTHVIAQFAKKTDQDMEDVAEVLDKAFRDPAKGAAELNRTLNFLSYEQLKYIDTLQKQGQTEQAQLALADALNAKLGTMQVHLNSVTGWWDKVTTSAANAWHAMFAPQTDASQLENLRRNLAGARDTLATAEPDSAIAAGARSQVALLQYQISLIEGKARAESDAAAEAERNKARERERIQLLGEYDKIADGLRTKEEKRAAAMEVLDKALKRNIISQVEYNRLAGIAARQYADKAGAEKQSNAYAQQQLQLTKDIEASRSKLAAVQAGITVEEGRSRANLEAWLELNRTALQLQPAQIANLRRMADEADRMAKALADANYVQSLRQRADAVGRTQEQALQAEIAQRDLSPEAQQQAQAEAARLLQRQDAETLKQLNRQYLANSSQVVAAASAQAEAQYGELLTRLVARGDEAGAALIRKLINLDLARAELQALQQQIDQVMGAQSRGQADIDLNVQTGLTSEIEARRQLVELNARTADEVAKLLPRMRELAQLTGDPAMAAGVDALDQRVRQLRTNTDGLRNAFSQAFEGGLASALEGLAMQTMSLGDAVRGLLSDIAGSMAQWAAQGISNQITTGLMGLFGGGASAAGDAAGAAGSAANTAAVTANTAAQAASTAAITTNATAATVLTPALTTLAGAATAAAAALQAAAAAAASSAGTSAAVGVAGAVAAATGGHITGPGSGTSDSITARLSNNEFVTRAAVVSQPGALQFLHAFNRHGMRALPGFADGGLVTSASMPSYRPTDGPAAGGSTTLQNSLALNLIDDPERIASVLGSPRGEKAFTVMISRNPQKFRQILGVK